MPVVFAFGPDGSYFMQTPQGRIWRNLPKHLEDHLNGETDLDPIDTVFWMMLPANKTYRMGWKDCKGVDRMTLPDQANNKRLCKFDEWANNQKYKHIMPQLKCSLGSDDSFWAGCNGSQRWNYIPKKAEEKLQAGRDPDLSDTPSKIKLVALGYGHSYFIAFEDHTSSWKIKSNYKALEEVFDEEKKKAERVVCIAMNPFERDQYFIAFDDGTSYWGLPKEYEAEVAELAAMLKRKEGDVVSGSTRNTPAPAEYVPNASVPSGGYFRFNDLVTPSSAAIPPAYSAGSYKGTVDEKEKEKSEEKQTKKPTKRRFLRNPGQWCKMM